jgi:hypothetical protein
LDGSDHMFVSLSRDTLNGINDHVVDDGPVQYSIVCMPVLDNTADSYEMVPWIQRRGCPRNWTAAATGRGPAVESLLALPAVAVALPW